MATVPVGEPAHADLAEDRRQHPRVAGLHGTVGHPVGVGHLGPSLPVGPHIEVVLEQPAQQLPATFVEAGQKLDTYVV